MPEKTLDVMPAGLGVEIHGPFVPEYRVTLDGYQVPYISATPCEDGRVGIVLDHRFGLPDPVAREEFDRWLPILANAMAIAAGYSCHGENSGPVNLFNLRVSQVSLPARLTVVE